MKATHILRKAMEEKKVSQRKLAKRFNTSPQCINAKINYGRQQMKADDFMNYMNFVGYETQFVDSEGNALELEEESEKPQESP